MTEIKTLRTRTRKYIAEQNTTKIVEMRDELYSLMLECEQALERRIN